MVKSRDHETIHIDPNLMQVRMRTRCSHAKCCTEHPIQNANYVVILCLQGVWIFFHSPVIVAIGVVIIRCRMGIGLWIFLSLPTIDTASMLPVTVSFWSLSIEMDSTPSRLDTFFIAFCFVFSSL
nr:hypothetical protein Iba_chr02aCG13680 [Ipomoea batatas]